MLTLMLAALAVGSWAQDATQRLVVWQKSGEKTYIDLTDEPVTTFEAGQLVIKTSRTTVYFQLENVLRYTYEGVSSTGIELQPGERLVSVSREGEALTFRNLQEGHVVTLFNTNGMMLEQATATAGQPLTLSVQNRPSGVYFVKVGKETYKLLKR